MKFLKSAKVYSDLVKLGHTLFAMPFALSALCLAHADGYSIGLVKFLWILLAFAGARSAAMGFNRIADADIDSLNPRTADRPTVTGKIPLFDAKVFTAISVGVFLFSAFMISKLCFALAFPALVVLFGYSYAKRFTYAAHYILGLALALAPAGAWIAAADSFDLRVLALSSALFFHIAGFDLFYSLQDMDFDIKHRLHSIPSRFGRGAALAVAGASFVLALVSLAAAGILFGLNNAYYAFVCAIAAVYIAGEALIIVRGESRTNLVFFYGNVLTGFLVLFGVASNLI